MVSVKVLKLIRKCHNVSMSMEIQSETHLCTKSMRQDKSINFYHKWIDYEEGFGEEKFDND